MSDEKDLIILPKLVADKISNYNIRPFHGDTNKLYEFLKYHRNKVSFYATYSNDKIPIPLSPIRMYPLGLIEFKLNRDNKIRIYSHRIHNTFVYEEFINESIMYLMKSIFSLIIIQQKLKSQRNHIGI